MKRKFMVLLLLALTAVILCGITLGKAFGKATSSVSEAQRWIYEKPALVAHAGGLAPSPTTGELIPITNSLETIAYNYEQGFRLFEFDLNLTSDGVLVAVHDWALMGKVFSEEEHLAYRINGEFTTMTFDDILEAMQEYPDMYLITDTKSFEYDDDEIIAQFQLIYDCAMARDEALLERIIPQIYNQDMYALIHEVYAFPSIMYTLYSSPDTLEEVVAFVKDKDDIPVIVRDKTAITEEFCAAFEYIGKKVYAHTSNDIDETARLMDMGVWGMYTDTITVEEFVALTADSR